MTSAALKTALAAALESDRKKRSFQVGPIHSFLFAAESLRWGKKIFQLKLFPPLWSKESFFLIVQNQPPKSEQ